jgi:hypothetical protein
MNTGGKFGVPTVPHFNGRLFEDADVPDEVTSKRSSGSLCSTLLTGPK